MAGKRTKVTLADIARQSGLSLSTVSLALNEKPGLPLDTRLKVINAARDLGYPMRSSPTSRTSMIQTIGMLVKRSMGDEVPPSTSYFFANVISGIETACRTANIALMYSAIPVDAHNNTLEIPRLLNDPSINGLLMVGNFIDETLDAALQARGVPTVLVDAYCCKNHYDSVITENQEGVYHAVHYLVQRGHRDIAFVGSLPDTRLSFRDRRLGYLKGLAEHGIQQHYFGDCPHNDREAVIETVRQLLLDQPQISAIIGCNDQVSLMSMHGAIEAGKRVPADISIIGFDDSLAAEISIPPLTTMHIDKEGLGRLGVRMLINRAENPDQAIATLSLHTEMVERQTVRDFQP